jgi:DNA-binding NtrC family response regulator
VPPLREHAEDIPELAADLSTRIVARLGIGRAPLTITPAALALMRAYGWPGNVRELRNVLERAAILTAPDGEVTPDVLHPLLGASGSSRGADASALNLRGRLDALEQETIREALTQAQGSKKEAARLLGIDPKNLSYYLRKHDLGETPT